MKIFKDLLFSFLIVLICVILALIITSIVWAAEPVDSYSFEEVSINHNTVEKKLPSLEEVKSKVVNTVANEINKFYRKDIPLDLPTQRLLFNACQEFDVDYDLALAVIWRETIFQNLYVASEGSSGYMMIQERWVKKEMEDLGATDLMNPKDNFRVGCYLLSDFIGRYGVEGGLTRYNTGHSGPSWYANSVMEKWMELKSNA